MDNFHKRNSYQYWMFAWNDGDTGMAIVEKDGTIIRSNPVFARELGYATSELVGMNVTEVTDPVDRMTGMREMELVINGELPFLEQDKRYVTKRGNSISAHLKSGPIRDEDGEIEHMVSLVMFYRNGSADSARVAALESQLDSVQKTMGGLMGAIVGRETKIITGTNIDQSQGVQVGGTQNHSKQGDTIANDNSSLLKYFALAIVAIVLVIALAFGANRFGFSFMGVEGTNNGSQIDEDGNHKDSERP